MQTGIFSEVLKAENRRIAEEVRSSLENPSTPLSYPAEWLLDIFNGGRTDSGIRVSPLSALQVVTVYACVDIISSAIASLPMNVYERILIGDQGLPGKRLAVESELFDLLHDDPNPEMTSFDWRKVMMCHALLWSNGYSELQRDGGNRVVAIWPRDPSKTHPRRDSAGGELYYVTTDAMDEEQAKTPGAGRKIEAANMIHLRGLSLDGRLGREVVNLARQAIGLSLALEKFGAKFFGNGAVLGGTLEYPGVLKADAKSNLERSWKEAHGGENHHAWAVLENGIKANSLGTKPNEAQMLESREFQIIEVGRLFHMPPHMLGITQGQARATAEQIGTEFVTYCLNPWIACWEQEARRRLFPPRNIGRNANKRMIVKLDTRKLMLPDADSRQKYYAGGRQWGWLTENAVLEMEDMNPSDNPLANETWMPVNMVLARTGGGQVDDDGPGGSGGMGGASENEPGAGSRAQRLLLGASLRVFRDAIGRVSSRSRVDRKAFEGIFRSVLFGIADLCLMNRSADFSPGGAIPDSLAACVRSHMAELFIRFDGWDGMALDDIALAESRRAVEVIDVAAEVAAQEIANTKSQIEGGSKA